MRRYIRTRLFSWATGRFISFHWWQEKSERTDRLFHCRTSHQSLDPLNRKLFALNTRNRKHVHFSNIPHFYHFLFSPLSRVFQRTKEQLFSNAHSEELCLLTLLRRITSSSSSSPPFTPWPHSDWKDVWSRQLRCTPCCGNHSTFWVMLMTTGKPRFDGTFN